MDWSKSFVVIKRPWLELIILLILIAFALVIRQVIALTLQLHHLHYFKQLPIRLIAQLSQQPIKLVIAPSTT